MKLARRILIGSIVPTAVIVAYGIWTTVDPDPFFPPIPKIADRFMELWVFARVSSDVVPSLVNLALGYAVAVLVGILLGALIGRVWWLRMTLLPLVNFVRSVPPIMLIPPLVLLLGIGDASKIVVIAIGALFPILLTTIDGLRATDNDLLDVGRAMRMGPGLAFRRIYLPGAMPTIFGGLHTGLQIAMVLMVSSEMIAAFRGVGYLTMQAQLTFDAPSVWAGIILLAVLGFLINLLFVAVRNRALRWHIRMTALARES